MWCNDRCTILYIFFREDQLIDLTNNAFWKLLNQKEVLLNFRGMHIYAE